MSSTHLITWMVLLPLLGAIAQAFIGPRIARGLGIGAWLGIALSLASSLIGFVLVISMRAQTSELQAVETLPWIGSFSISYSMGLDGMNALLVLLISVLFPLLIASEWRQKLGTRGMHALLLVLQSSLVGAVCAQDLFLMFFFWALSALPFYFLVGIWGGEARESAAFRMMVSNATGNALFFAALVLIFYSADPHTFLLSDLSGGKLEKEYFSFFGYDFSVSATAFALIAGGLALRMPVWPLHGWFTDAAEESPPSVLVALSAAAVPVAIYIFVRLGYSLFPQTIAVASDAIVIVGAINLLIGGICALSQRNLKLLLAFACLSQIGLILVGIGSLTAAGMVGAIYQLLAFGLGIGGLGLFLGILVSRTGQPIFLDDAGLSRFGGVAPQAPVMALVAGIVTASLLGVPGTGGFVGHALLMIGSFSVHPTAVLLGGASLILASYYLFTMYRHVFLGAPRAGAGPFEDLSLREQSYLLPLVAALLVLGIYPKPLIELVRPTVLTLLSTIK